MHLRRREEGAAPGEGVVDAEGGALREQGATAEDEEAAAGLHGRVPVKHIRRERRLDADGGGGVGRRGEGRRAGRALALVVAVEEAEEARRAMRPRAAALDERWAEDVAAEEPACGGAGDARGGVAPIYNLQDELRRERRRQRWRIMFQLILL